MAKRAALQGSVFVGSPQGLGVQFKLREDGVVVAECKLSANHEGPPRHAHGGALASLLDEAMGAAAWLAGYRVVAVHLECDYRLAVPLDTDIVVEGRVERHEGRKVFTSSIIILNGSPAVTGKGIFVEAPQFFDEPGFHVIEENSD